MSELSQIWTYLAEEPLLWLTATLIAYSVGDAAFKASGKRAYVNPVLIAVTLLAVVLWTTATPYQTYFEGAQFVHFMLGPATGALAAPLYGNLSRIRRYAIPLVCSLLVGSVTAILSALGVAYALGVRGDMLISIAPKSVTAPVALGISESLGGQPTLTAVLVILTGVMGAVMATPLLNRLGVTDWHARGFAVGVASHGIGTARAFQVNETAGAFAGIGMGLNALLTTVLAPIIVSLFV
jgi:predicted murein hydrolase (TIGR00659 family)